MSPLRKTLAKFLFLATSVFIFSSCSTALMVSYTHNPLAADGCQVDYSVQQQNDSLYIIVSLSSERLVFSENPTLKFKNFNGEILELKWKQLSTQSESTGIMVNNMIFPFSEIHVMAQFKVDDKQISFFEPGICKVHISTVPIAHNKIFLEDKIGGWLYNKLQETHNSKNIF